ncbi:MAG: hypothetical protein MI975_25160, partial [Cytophagales bacterium]|nr:hypothetical protein [Cytophagales bacterium]
MKKLIIEKQISYIFVIVAMLSSLSAFSQLRESKNVEVKELNFTHSLPQVEGKTGKHLVVELDRKQVKKV